MKYEHDWKAFLQHTDSFNQTVSYKRSSYACAIIIHLVVRRIHLLLSYNEQNKYQFVKNRCKEIKPFHTGGTADNWRSRCVTLQWLFHEEMSWRKNRRDYEQGLIHCYEIKITLPGISSADLGNPGQSFTITWLVSLASFTLLCTCVF